MPKPLLPIACVILICSVCSLAADRSATSFASLPPEAQASIRAALRRDSPIQDFTLTASNGVDGDAFGYSVAIDGNTVVVGAPFSTVNGNQQQGSAYVFVKPTNGWANMTQTAQLTSSDGQPLNYFGNSVAISGNTVVVGSPQSTVNGNSSQGAAYVFVEPTNGWTNMTETAKLSASDGAPYGFFGMAAAINGNTIAVGSPYSTGGNMLPGAAYVFVEPSGGWVAMTQTAELGASDGSVDDGFGRAVSVNSNTVIIGGAQCGDGECPGSAYIYVEPANGWADMTETAELTPSDGGAADSFGSSVSLDGDTAVVGVPDHIIEEAGAVYVFVEQAGGWVSTTQTAELTVRDTKLACVGSSVSIAGNIILAGADCTHGNAGAAYVFLKPAGGWQNTSKFAARLSIPFKYPTDGFGQSVAISGTVGVIGAPYAPTLPGCHSGCSAGSGEAFIFTAQ